MSGARVWSPLIRVGTGTRSHACATTTRGCRGREPSRPRPRRSRRFPPMPTDLFVAASGWPSSALADVVPPACRRDVEAAPAPRRDGDDAVVELPVWRPRRAARHLVPAFSALHPAPASFRFEVSLERAGRWSAWVAGATIGEARFAPLGGRTDGLAAEIDEFVAEAPAHALRVRLRPRVDDRHAPLAAPWLVSLSAWDGSLPTPDMAPGGGAVRLAVPALSQMDADEAIRMRICSPASVAMVLAYWSARVEVASLARDIFHPGLDRYGVWPAAIRAAGAGGRAPAPLLSRPPPPAGGGQPPDATPPPRAPPP